MITTTVTIYTRDNVISMEVDRYTEVDVIEPNQYKIGEIVTTLKNQVILKVTREQLLFDRKDPLKGYIINPNPKTFSGVTRAQPLPNEPLKELVKCQN